MRKISLLVAVIMLFSLIPTMRINAADGIVANSTFNEGSSGWIGAGGTFVLENDDALGIPGGKSYRTKYSSVNTEYRCLNVQLTPGRVYELQFYAKSDTAGAEIQGIRTYRADGVYYFDNIALTKNWKKYSVEFVAPTRTNHGAEATVDGDMYFRLMTPGTSVWLDEVYFIDPTIVEEEEIEYSEPYEQYKYSASANAINMDGFADTKGHWAELTTTLMKNENVVSGVGNGMFLPDKKVTRAEFLKMLIAKLNLEENGYKGAFSDVKAEKWYSGIVQNAIEMGIISPVLIENGNFKPDSEVNREDAAVFVSSYIDYIGLGDKESANTFTDDSVIDAQKKESVYNAVRKGIINGYTDGRFSPKKILTRAEAVQIIRNILEYDGPMAVYVNQKIGKKGNPGTIEAPFKTLEEATEYIDAHNDKMDHHLYVLMQGEIFVDETIALTPKDTGNGVYSVIYSSYGNEQALISGGKHFKGGWEDDNTALGIKKLFVGEGIKTRQMFVNGMRMTRAKTDTGFENPSYMTDDKTGYYTEDLNFANHRDIDDLEFVWLVTWTEPRVTATKVEAMGEGLKITMEQPGFKYAVNKGHLAVDLPDHFENQYEFLDEPGEWYLDKEGWLYCIPYDFMDLQTADIVLPVTEKLITVYGTKENKAKNISFINVGFGYNTWLRPSGENGFSDAQGGRFREGADHIPDSSVWVQYTDNVTFKDCTFSKLGSTALNVTDNVTDVNIVGNHIYDISGCGMYVGNHNADGKTVFGAANEDYPSERVLIQNNYIHDYGVEYGSSDGIELMCASYANVTNNEVYNGRYSGIVVGYGKNRSAGYKYAIDVQNNYVHDVLNGHVYDGGAIYVTEMTDGTFDRYNTIQYNYLENQRNYSSVLYLDNSSSFWNVNHNVVDTRRMLLWHRNRQTALTPPKWFSSGGWDNNPVDYNYISIESQNESHKGGDYTNPDGEAATFGEHIYYIDLEKEQWPSEAKSIIQNAGLTQDYLAKFAENDVQYLEVDTYTKHYLKAGESLNAYEAAGIRGYGRKYEEKSIENEKIYFTTDRPDLIKVESDGTVTSLATGIANVRVIHIKDDIVRIKTFQVSSADEYDHAELDMNEMNIYVGNTYNIGTKAYTKLGDEIEKMGITYKIDDESIATVDENGNVTAKGEGATKLHVYTDCLDVKEELVIPVNVKNRPKSDTFDLSEYFVVDFEGAKAENWDKWFTPVIGDQAVAFEGGVKLIPPRRVASYTKYNCDELLRMKVTMNHTTKWQSLNLRATDHTKQYDEVGISNYMISFVQGKGPSIERFAYDLDYSKMDRSRTSWNGQQYVNFDFQNGKEYEMILGCVTYDDYTDVIVVVDGQLVGRWKDYGEQYNFETGEVARENLNIKQKGCFQVHSRARDASVVIKPAD